MCIRDSARAYPGACRLHLRPRQGRRRVLGRFDALAAADALSCLLYTSDAADERSSVDLGGRRIIKKKKQKKIQGAQPSSNTHITHHTA